MTEHPITPPPELVEQWECEYHHMTWGPDMSMFLTEKAARWGADQELKACYEWIVRDWTDIQSADMLLNARRPKPPSLKEQALADLAGIPIDPENGVLVSALDNIRRALESLP